MRKWVYRVWKEQSFGCWYFETSNTVQRVAARKVLFEKHDRSRQHGIDTTMKSKKNGVSDELAKDLNLEMANQECLCPFLVQRDKNLTKVI